jgi:hypothetical protein
MRLPSAELPATEVGQMVAAVLQGDAQPCCYDLAAKWRAASAVPDAEQDAAEFLLQMLPTGLFFSTYTLECVRCRSSGALMRGCLRACATTVVAHAPHTPHRTHSSV